MVRGKRAARGSGKRVAALAIAFCAGVLVDSWLRVYGPPQPASASTGRPLSAAPLAPLSSAPLAPLSSAPLAPLSPAAPAPASSALTHPTLRMPIDGVDVEKMKGEFAQSRPGHAHEAVDLPAPRNTPVHAVDAGNVAKLFVSRAGGNTIYQFDPTAQVCYYYAHLERYADGLREGDAVSRGEVIGYVGTSGNAPPNVPHLHFAVFELTAARQWWKGRAIDPYLLFKGSTDTS